jgi:type IV pilus assembly protein PilC
MSTFACIARSSDGRTIESVIEAVSRHEALARMREKGLLVTSLREEGEHVGANAVEGAAVPDRLTAWLRKSAPVKVSAMEKAVFCRQLAISVGAGVPLKEALESIAEQAENHGFRRTLSEIVGQMGQGKAFSQAIGASGQLFGPMFIALVRAAEEAGSMPKTLEYLAISMEKADRLRRRIRSIIAYPVFIAIFFCLVGLIMTLFIVPKFQDVFAGFDSEPPMLTRVVFGLNKVLIDNLAAIVTVAGGLIGALFLFGRTRSGRLRIDGLKLKLPLVGRLLKKLAVARFCRNLAIMLRGGVPIAAAMEITCEVCSNVVMKSSLSAARSAVITGRDIASSLQMQGVFPPLVVRMIRVGEASGQLPEVLDKVSEMYDDHVESSLMLATSLLEPVIICVFGVIVTCLVLAVYMPVFTVSANVK